METTIYVTTIAYIPRINKSEDGREDLSSFRDHINTLEKMCQQYTGYPGDIQFYILKNNGDIPAAYRKEYVKYVEDVEGGKKVNKENKVEIEVLQQRVEVSFVVSRPNLEVSELREKMTLLIYIESAETLISHQDIVRYLNLEAPYF
ncbi:MAG TPA: hypothetical protein VJC39_02250 [Candidatus Nanoarchaeia archaeon]|nr:hypothetical protein [Candidatus Nanoarchaeia archaeon]